MSRPPPELSWRAKQKLVIDNVHGVSVALSGGMVVLLTANTIRTVRIIDDGNALKNEDVEIVVGVSKESCVDGITDIQIGTHVKTEAITTEQAHAQKPRLAPGRSSRPRHESRDKHLLPISIHFLIINANTFKLINYFFISSIFNKINSILLV